MPESLLRNILATITYFDVFDYPMTSYEVFAYFIDSERLLGGSGVKSSMITLGNITWALELLVQKRKLVFDHGYYYLPRRNGLSSQRRHRSKASEIKLRKIRRLFWWFRFVPFVRMVGVTGTLSMKNIDQESDWDVFVVLRDGYIWTGRTIMTILLQLMGKRRHGDLEKDRVCLNYYVTDASLEISLKDLFAAREYAFMTPLIGGITYKKFERKNAWITRFMPNWSESAPPSLLLVRDTKTSYRVRLFWEKMLESRFVEKKLKKWQKKKIKNNPKTQISGGYIQADDDGLIFLPKPQGPITFEKFKERLREVL